MKLFLFKFGRTRSNDSLYRSETRIIEDEIRIASRRMVIAGVLFTVCVIGAILFFTKKGGYSSSTRLGIQNLKLAGYSTPKEFYSPKYNVELSQQSFPDYRTTIFWAPEILTDSVGKATVTFYNSDYETNITGIIEGISSFGSPGVRIFKYEVSKQ